MGDAIAASRKAVGVKRALFLTGGWEGHEPAETTAIVATALEARGFHTEVATRIAALEDGDHLRGFDLIVPNWTMGTLTDAAERALLDAVAAGTGIAGWHGGLADAFRDRTAFQFMVGGQFVAHPGDAVRYDVRLLPTPDGLLDGIDDFQLTSEQYYLHVDPSNEVLATTTFSGEHVAWIAGTVMPVAWRRRWGAGKVFYSSPGHGVRDFAVREVLELTVRGLHWAAR